MKKKFIAPRITSTIIEEEVMVAASKCPHHNTGWAQTPNAPYTDVDKTGDLNEEHETKKNISNSRRPMDKKMAIHGMLQIPIVWKRNSKRGVLGTNY